MQMEAGSESTTAEPELSTLMYVGRAACVFLSMGLSGFLALVGAFGVQAATQSSPIPTDSYQVIFMGVYMVIFATTIFFFELFQLLPSPLQCVDDMYKRNFGFMYGPIGRGCYLIIIGVFAFGLSTPRTLAIATAVLTAAWGSVMIILAVILPDLFPKNVKYNPAKPAQQL